jgi:hypothetical protein
MKKRFLNSSIVVGKFKSTAKPLAEPAGKIPNIIFQPQQPFL